METRNNKKIHMENYDEYTDNSKFVWTTFNRQLLVCSSTFMIYFVTGLSFGTPTIFISYVRREVNSTAALSEEMVTWLSSTPLYSAVPSVFILISIVRVWGRKGAFTLVCITTFAGYIVFFFTTSPVHLLISELLVGLAMACNMTVSVMVVSEYTTPKYRGVFLTIKSATFFWGIWVANAIGTFYHWRFISILGLICTTYTLTIYFWPESPYWLASKGRFDECIASHRWLKGTDKNSERELHQIITLHEEKYAKSLRDKKPVLHDQIIRIIKKMLSRAFYKPMLLSVVLMTQYHCSGKLVVSMYAIQLLNKIMANESAAYSAMLVLDGVTIVGMYCGCALSKFLNRRTLLLWSSSLGILFLFLLATYLFIVKLGLVVENGMISIMLLTIFSLCISCGPMIMATSIYGELIPVRFRNVTSLIFVLVINTMGGTFLKLAPLAFKTFDLYGTFFIYAVSATFFTIIIFFYLPETKDKTLQEIEQYFNKKVIPSEKTNRLASRDPGNECSLISGDFT